MKNLNVEYESAQNNGKKALSILFISLFCLLAVVSVLLSVFIVSLSLSKTPENTLEVFGYKVYCAENDIEEIPIKAGSLVVVRDTDTDEYYTHDSLSENIVFSVENIGYTIQHDFVWMTLCVTAPLTAFFLLILLSELKKISAKKRESELVSNPQQDVNDLPSTSQNETEIVL